MEKIRFEEALNLVTKNDQRYQKDGYHFLREALDHTVKDLRGDELIEHRHVSGPELVEGLVNYALGEYGSMAAIVLDSWGIESGEDVGKMVFNLIEVGAFGKSEEDSPADFANLGNLHESLRSPYRPTREVLRKRNTLTADAVSRSNKPVTPSEA